ncbi:MAG: PhoH family protein [gamma proteobacterium symbiont of Bathyaustriella thionipta]|nr:PhoH family protein [gamma proteobacterium symbiont of Bathyaustriella thionipta]MCU7950554.1 PhoH family protein [gamma proteobacterium symbiont of Bathyaustriella thionipta]MCU7953065.1 PhoH family protein [gamma proteobacterium symbiont of Bathyaustriella thionipta]MCU7957068.1 PhoH family protein [gamma proteobacterium symbiont of Bathyaustriella thionipta]MCU7966622.1 PhoH family protein [gamma proteobacterium symbiont of Bathyaustriella thionipta]
MENENSDNEKRLFVLDTNVLIHDPSSLFRFSEHDLFLPMVVLEELDNNKKGHSEVARNARQASRFLDDLTSCSTPEEIKNGLDLNLRIGIDDDSEEALIAGGKLFLQTTHISTEIPVTLPGQKNDNDILGITVALQSDPNLPPVSLISKDINLRIKAAAIGIQVEDYNNDQVLEDVNLLYSGVLKLDNNFWDLHDKEVDSWTEEGHTYHKISGNEVKKWQPNQIVSIGEDSSFESIVRENTEEGVIVEQVRQFYSEKQSVWGISARNPEQNYALNLLMDPEIDFVSLVGQAGTGKTLLALAAGLSQVMDEKIYQEIIMTRATISVGEDIGFLPGTEEEKMAPWMGALMDNLEVLTHNEDAGEWGKQATNDLLATRIKIRSLNFMRGRTFLNRFIILDEAQNLTSKQMKTLITRAGPGTKIICLGNIAQIDTPYLTETTSGLTFVVDRFRKWEHSGHITLRRGERSRLADFAADVL